MAFCGSRTGARAFSGPFSDFGSAFLEILRDEVGTLTRHEVSLVHLNTPPHLLFLVRARCATILLVWTPITGNRGSTNPFWGALALNFERWGGLGGCLQQSLHISAYPERRGVSQFNVIIKPFFIIRLNS